MYGISILKQIDEEVNTFIRKQVASSTVVDAAEAVAKRLHDRLFT